MRLRTFKHNNHTKVGIVKDDLIYTLPYNSMNELIESNKSTQELLSLVSDKINVAETEILAPIPNPKQDIICLGINYMAHAEESARYKKEAFGGDRPYAVYFSKRANECVATEGNIPSYSELVDSLDYECELAVIIGKDAKNVSKEKHITEEMELSQSKLVMGFRTQISAGDEEAVAERLTLFPYTTLFRSPPVLSIQSYINGELRQDSNTGLLIFDIPHVISELSQGTTLKAGTIISMGTPAGVGMGFQPPKFLKKGDVIECRIEKIGSLKNYVI